MKRVIVSPSLVRVSRPGVDANNPPAITSQYLALDSSWLRTERLLTLAVIHETSLASPKQVNFDARPSPPLGMLIKSSGATIFGDGIGYIVKSGEIFVYGSHYISASFNDHMVCWRGPYQNDPAK